MPFRKLIRRLAADPAVQQAEIQSRVLDKLGRQLAKLERALEKRLTEKLKNSLGDRFSAKVEKTVERQIAANQRPWEDLISLNSFDEGPLDALGPPAAYLPDLAEQWQGFWRPHETPMDWNPARFAEAAAKDTHPLPPTADREGYYGDDHFKYWASGLREMLMLEESAAKWGVAVDAYLDLGCATGRVLRHFASQRATQRVCGTDINRRHIEWICKHLPPGIEAAQTTSIPTLPFADDTFDLVTAFSVFTHVEAFETAWLLELKRILKPGGLAWITFHSEGTWADLQPDWPLYGGLSRMPDFRQYLDARGPLPRERMVFRYRASTSYSSNVFYHTDYIRRVWGRIFEFLEIQRRVPDYQDVALMRKPRN